MADVLIATAQPAEFRETLSVLRQRGHQVVLPKQGTLAAATLHGSLFDGEGLPSLLIIDGALQKGVGLSLLSSVRMLDASAPVFFLVDYGDSATAQQAFSKGATRVFERPIRSHEICSAAAWHLGTRTSWAIVQEPGYRGHTELTRPAARVDRHRLFFSSRTRKRESV